MDGNDGADIMYGDSMLGPGSGRDRLLGGWGADIMYGDSLAGEGSGQDYLFGDLGDDTLLGDSYLGQGTGNDTILGSLGADKLYGDSYEGMGAGSDRLDGGMDDDVVYGDSVQSDGFGTDVVLGGEGNDLLAGDSEKGDGSGTDWLDGGLGTDVMHGDSLQGEDSGHDMLVRGEAGEAAAGQAMPGDTVIAGDVENPIHSYEVNGHSAQYREDPDTGAIQVYNYELGQWYTVAERYWDAERDAWVTSMGQDVIAEYAAKTIRYDNYGTDMSILKDGAWQPYDPDDQYVVDFKEDPATGELLVYDNDLGTWDPYVREYTPAGEDYTVLNDGHTILITDATGCMLSLENYGDGAGGKAADSYRWVELAGDLLYHDAHTNIWYAHGWGSWSYSIDLGATWQEVPMLQISVSTDGNGGTGSVDIFDRTSISHDDAGLQFFDERYAQSGLHSMNDFYVDLYDGKGYDGEPLVTCYYYFTESDDQDAARGAMTSIPDSGPGDPPESGVVPTEAKIVIFGKWTDKCKAEFEIPNPSSAESVTAPQGPLTVVLQADDCPAAPTRFDYSGWELHAYAYKHIHDTLAPDVIYKRYSAQSYSVEELVSDLCCLQYVASDSTSTEIQIENLVISCHDRTMGEILIGGDRVTRYNLNNYEESFNSIGRVMVNGGQFQYHACSAAGPDPFAYAEGFDPRQLEKPKEYGPYTGSAIQADAWWARSLFGLIANWTETKVFASSDTDEYKIELIQNVQPVATAVDWSLEFGIGPDGVQVDFSTCKWQWLDFTQWRGVEAQSVSAQTAQWDFDAELTVVDYKHSDGTYMAIEDIPTPGETGGRDYSQYIPGWNLE